MKVSQKLFVKFVAMFSLSVSTTLFAQNREIQDSLIYTDPTVSKSSDYIYGGSLEYWYSHKSINNSTYSATSTLTQPGFNIFVGKDNITASLSYKGFGSSNVQIGTSPANVWGAGVLSEVEGSLRVRSNDRYFGAVYPYLIVGYLSGRSNTYSGSVTSTSPIFGLGGIVPFNEKFGLRTDIKILSYKQSPDSHFPNDLSTTTAGNQVTGNFYWNLDKDWNAQLGARKTYFAGGGPLSYGLNNTSIGYFVMIGKTYNK